VTEFPRQVASNPVQSFRRGPFRFAVDLRAGSGILLFSLQTAGSNLIFHMVGKERLAKLGSSGVFFELLQSDILSNRR
jgi:hypothetical protein